MPGYATHTVIFLFCLGSFFMTRPLSADDTERSRAVVSFAPAETSESSRHRSQLHGFREALTTQPPRPAVSAEQTSVVTADMKPEKMPAVRQVAMAEPLPVKPVRQDVVPAENADEPETIGHESKTDLRRTDDAVLDKPIGFGQKENAQGKLERPRLAGAVAPIVSVIGSLLIVLSAFFILMMILKKMSPKKNRLLPKEAFEDLGRTFLTQKLQLHLLRLGNRLILVSVTPDGVSPITEVTDPDEVVPLLGMCRKLDENSSTELFRKMYANLSENDGHETPVKKPGRISAKSKSKASSLVDLYSEPDESLADILASGLGPKGAGNV